MNSIDVEGAELIQRGLRACQAEKVTVFWPEDTTMQSHRSVQGFLGNSILSFYIMCTAERTRNKADTQA